MEIIAVVLTLLCVWLTSKRSIWCWPVGIASALSYMCVFYLSGSIANMWLQPLYVIQSIYGWLFWRKRSDEKFLLTISPKRFLVDLSIVFVLTVLLSTFLSNNNDIQPTYDAITTLLSILGTWYISRKNAYGWLTFLIADIFFTFMFLSQERYLSAILYVVLAGMCVYGLVEWIKPEKK